MAKWIEYSTDLIIRLEKDRIYPSNIRTQGPDERVSPHFGDLVLFR